MMERFTRDARDAVIEAQTVARETGSHSIDTRHVLLGVLVRSERAAGVLDAIGVDRTALGANLRRELETGDLDAEALARLGIDLEAVRMRTDDVFGRGALDRAAQSRRSRRRSGSGHLPFTSDAKQCLNSTLREAIRLDFSDLDGGLILLGILRTTGSPGGLALARALAAAGSSVADLERVVSGPAAAAS